MTPDDLAAIRARAEASSEDIGITYSVPADEWAITSDKPTMQMLRHSRADINALLAEVDLLRAGMAEGDRCIDQAGREAEELRAERDAAREDCGYQRTMRQFVSDERDRFMQRAIHAEAEVAYWKSQTEALAAKIERVEALAAECEGQHGQCWNSIFGQRIRAALADPLAASEEQEES